MRKLWPIVAVVLAPLVHVAACGSDSATVGAGGAGGSTGAVGGVIQDYDWTLVVTWTIDGAPPSTGCDASGAATVAMTLSGTEDESLHSTQMLDCKAGTVTYKGLTRLTTGDAAFVEGSLLNDMMMTIYVGSAPAPAAPGTVTINIDFNASGMSTSAATTVTSTSTTTTTTTTTGQGGSTGAGHGGAMGQGGATSTTATSTTHTTTTGNGGSSGQGGAGGG